MELRSVVLFNVAQEVVSTFPVSQRGGEGVQRGQAQPLLLLIEGNRCRQQRKN